MTNRYTLVSLAIAIFLVLSLGLLITNTPSDRGYPAAITRESSVTYELGETVLVRPYGSEWYNGKVVGVTGKDDYIVDLCGNFGWFNKKECTREEVKRSEMAKVKQ